MVAALQLYTIVVQYDLNLAGPYCNQIALLNRGEDCCSWPAAAASGRGRAGKSRAGL